MRGGWEAKKHKRLQGLRYTVPGIAD